MRPEQLVRLRRTQRQSVLRQIRIENRQQKTENRNKNQQARCTSVRRSPALRRCNRAQSTQPTPSPTTNFLLSIFCFLFSVFCFLSLLALTSRREQRIPIIHINFTIRQPMRSADIPRAKRRTRLRTRTPVG